MRKIVHCAVGLAFASVIYASDSLEEKFLEVQDRYENGSEAPKDFEIDETEANVYLRQEGGQQLPEGVESPWIKFDDSLAVVGATLDLDALEDELPDSMIFQLLSGRVPVELTARLNGDAGIGKLDVERVVLSGVELPPELIASLVDGRDTSGFLPPGFRIGQAFTLPFDLESIRLTRGAAVVRQRASGESK